MPARALASPASRAILDSSRAGCCETIHTIFFQDVYSMREEVFVVCDPNYAATMPVMRQFPFWTESRLQLHLRGPSPGVVDADARTDGLGEVDHHLHVDRLDRPPGCVSVVSTDTDRLPNINRCLQSCDMCSNLDHQSHGHTSLFWT